MSAKGLPPPSASEGQSSAAGDGPIGGIKQAHADMVAWLYKPHGGAVDDQLKKIDAANVKREHIAYGVIGLVSLYLLFGEEAMFPCIIRCCHHSWKERNRSCKSLDSCLLSLEDCVLDFPIPSPDSRSSTDLQQSN
ncbi:unnamed protein product [Cylicocyclus nassatus]|uniref:Uncharacterized protein n=1 Tax=Cylicocyclus nassatus TaxID=53992 RepID=A0AA36GT94_CYLNA|nr:unnamed protein product [Cylicocyclus nassatus]